MIRKRLPSPLLSGLHLTSEDSNGNDALSPVSDTLQTNTFSDAFDKGHLTGPGSFLQAHQISGPNSLLDSDELHLTPGDSGTSLDQLSGDGSPLGGTASLSSVTGNLGSGSGIIGVRRGIVDLDPSELKSNIPDVATQGDQTKGGLPLAAGPIGFTGLGGRLRGMRVNRMVCVINIIVCHQSTDKSECRMWIALSRRPKM
jgi:hypothetical protein